MTEDRRMVTSTPTIRTPLHNSTSAGFHQLTTGTCQHLPNPFIQLCTFSRFSYVACLCSLQH